MPMGIQSRHTYSGLVSSETASREKEACLLVNTGEGERERSGAIQAWGLGDTNYYV